MSSEPEPMPEQSEPSDTRRARPAWITRFLCGCGSNGLNLCILLGVLVVLAINQPLRLPDHVATKVEGQIEKSLPGIDISFGAMNVQVAYGWRPSLRLRDVRIADAEGQVLAHLSDLGASLAMRPLLQGDVQPKHMWLSGAVGQLLVGADGSVQLSFSDAPDAPTSQSAPSPMQLMEAWDSVFDLPQFSALREVELRGLTLQYADVSRNWQATLDGGWMTIKRIEDDLRVDSGFAVLSGGDGVSSVEMRYESLIGSPEAEFEVLIEDADALDVAVQSPGLEWLSVVQAPISGTLNGGVNEAGSLEPLRASLDLKAGFIQPTPGARAIPFNAASTRVSYDSNEQVIRFEELSIDSPLLRASAGGEAAVTLRPGTLTLSSLTGQFAVAEIRLEAEQVYDEPLFLQGLSSDFRLDLDPFHLSLAGTRISDGQSDIRIDGDITSGDAGWRVALDAGIDRITPERVVALWPRDALPRTRSWLNANLTDGELRDVDASIRHSPGEKLGIAVDFDFVGSKIRFLKAMPPMSKAVGQASFVGRRFVATASEGIVDTGTHGAIDVSGTSFIVPDTDIGQLTPAIVRLQAEGDVPAVMALLNLPPLSVLEGSDLPVALAQGRARAEGTLSTPMAPVVPADQIQYHFDGTIEAVTSDVLVPGHLAKAESLAVTGTHRGITIEGAALVSDLPAQVRWHQPIGPGTSGGSQVTGQVELSQRAVDAFEIGLPSDALSGTGQAQMVLDIGGGAPPRLQLFSDLDGLEVAIPPLGWRKPPNQTGSLELDVTLGAQPRVDRMSLSAAGLTADGQVLMQDGQLSSVEIAGLRIGNWLDVTGRLVGRGAGLAPDVQVNGGRLDLRGFNPQPSDAAGTPGGLSVALDQLVVAEQIRLRGMQGEFDLAQGLDGTFSGALNGAAPVSGQISPNATGLNLRVKSSRAGEVLRAMRILRRASGGDLDLALATEPGNRIEAQARITDLTVRDAPVLASLLNTISVVGLVTELSGQGLQFDRVDARFAIDPNGAVTLYEGSAEGASVGLSADGIIDTQNGQMDLRGVISPVYFLNAVGSVITRRGEGVLGFNYRLRGPVSGPSVSINPLSVLTPSVLRNIFRSSAPPSRQDSDTNLLPEAERPADAPRRYSPNDER